MRMAQNKDIDPVALPLDKQVIIQNTVTRGLDSDVLLKSSGVQWIKQVPCHWNIERIKYGLKEKKPLKNNNLPSGSISYGVVILKNSDKIPLQTRESYQEVLSGEYLINPINLNYDLVSLRTALSNHDVCVSPAYIVLNGIPEKIIPSYGKYILLVFDIQHMKTLGGGTRQTINFKDIGECLWALPPLHEQTAIADFLDTKTTQIDQAIKIKEQQITLLNEYKQIIIQNAVTRGVKGSRGVRLKHACSLYGDYGLNVSADTYVEQGVPLIRTSDFDDSGKLNFFEAKFISYNVARDKLLKSGDVLFSRAGTIGRSTTFEGKYDATFAAYLVRFRPNSKKLFSRFLHHWARSEHFWEQVRADTIESTIGNFNAAKLGNLSLPEIDIDEQIAIADFLDSKIASIYHAIEIKTRQIATLREYRATLINAAVTGKLEIT